MSIPSSKLEVATMQGISPAFSSSSTTCRSSRASEPWWARAISTGGAGSPVAAAPPSSPGIGFRRSVAGTGDLPATSPSLASSFSRSAIRSAERRLLTKRIVERWAWISFSSSG